MLWTISTVSQPTLRNTYVHVSRVYSGPRPISRELPLLGGDFEWGTGRREGTPAEPGSDLTA